VSRISRSSGGLERSVESAEADLTERLLAAFPDIDAESVRVHLALGKAFHRSVRALEAYVLPNGRAFNRTKSNFLALLYLADGHQLTVGALGRELGLSPASATRLLDSFESDGLMERASHPADRRITYARLTIKGLRECETILPHFLQFMQDIAALLSPAQRLELAELLATYESGGDLIVSRNNEE
jgi:MarR family 2-MHQ and catechol resistance regulon transcriptional repressor